VADTCPCGSGELDVACCAPLIAGAPAPTALALMRSRYVAYVRGEIDYLLATHHSATRDDIDRDAVTGWSRHTAWQGLEIIAVDADDTTGTVEFIARGATRGTPFVHHERSQFRRTDGHWYYVDGKQIAQRRPPAPGRNDPCPCGSGMKYKRCHGA